MSSELAVINATKLQLAESLRMVVSKEELESKIEKEVLSQVIDRCNSALNGVKYIPLRDSTEAVARAISAMKITMYILEERHNVALLAARESLDADGE